MFHRTFTRTLVIFFLILVTFSFLSGNPIRAAGIVVTTAADNTTDDGLCSLREAIESANTDTDLNADCGGGGSGADTITFDATLDGSPITLNGSSLPTIIDDLTITGNGETQTVIQAANCNPITLPDACTPASYRVMQLGDVLYDPDVSLEGLTIQHGNSSGAAGAGIYNYTSGVVSLTDVTLHGNSAGTGGGMYNINSSPTLINVTFSGNKASGGGGGLFNSNSSPTLINVLFVANTATNGGAIFDNAGGGSTNPTLINSTLVYNISNSNGGAINHTGGTFTIHNSILWDNVAGGSGTQIYNNAATVDIDHSLVYSAGISGGWTDNGSNISAAPDQPEFVRDASPGGDGLWNGVNDDYGDLRLTTSSPAVDAGDDAAVPGGVTVDRIGMPRFMDGDGDATPTVDMGAYETRSNPIYVDVDALGADTGYTWTDAFPTLQDALAVALPGHEIWVAEGIYYPDEGSGQVNGDRTSTFQLISGVAIYGGFDGTETMRSQSDPDTHITILSGDVDQNDTFSPDFTWEEYPVLTTYGGIVPDASDTTGLWGYGFLNAYHVVTGSGADTTAMLNGVTITAGYANGSSPDNSGGGVFNDNGSPTLTDIDFTGNAGGLHGGGVSNRNGSNPTLIDATFTRNRGGIYNDSSSPILTEVTFSGNRPGSQNGGGVLNTNGSSPILTNVAFTGNRATSGGGMFNGSGSSPILTNVIFNGNHVNQKGGGMYNNASSPVLINVTFSGNHASSNGGGMANENSSSPILTNVILWGNTATNVGPQVFNDFSTPSYSYSLIEGSGGSGSWLTSIGTDGGNNVDADPLFNRNPDPGDANWTTLADNDYGDLRLTLASPVLDAGDNAAVPGGVTGDLAGNMRIADGDGDATATVDMGAYETIPNPIYVDVDAVGNGDGTSWADAFTTLQDALAVVISGHEIWVAEGIYYPDEGGVQINDDRTSTFQLLSGVAVYGGFDGTETMRSQRDPDTYVTVLSGDIDQNDTFDDGGGPDPVLTTYGGIVPDATGITGTWASQTGNAYHVLTGSGVNDTAVLDGVTITAGYAAGPSPDNSGGGVYILTGDPTFAGVSVTGNQALQFGGGIYLAQGSLELTDSTFSGNQATTYGGGISNFNSSLMLTNATFIGNQALYGGGMQDGGVSTLTNVTFSGNAATQTGGGLYSTAGPSTLTDVHFTGNTAVMWGGGMNIGGSANVSLTDVTFSENQADRGGGLSNDADVELTNITFTGNQAADKGGGMYGGTFGFINLMTNVIFSGNQADFGGGLYLDNGSPDLSNITFSGNHATSHGGGLYNKNGSNPTMVNVILWHNTAINAGPNIFNDFSDPNFSYSLIEGSGGSGGWDSSFGLDGGSNIDTDPLFISLPDPGDGDWTTLSDNDYGDLHLQPCSPASDSGDDAAVPGGVTVDLDGNQRFDGTVDMGPYERVGGAGCVDLTPPSNPSTVESSSHTSPVWSNDDTIDMTWTNDAADAESGVAGYSTVWDTIFNTTPDDIIEHGAGTLNETSPPLGAGSWFFHLRTCDNVDNCSAAVHVGPFPIDTVDPDDPTTLSSSSHTVGLPSLDDTIYVDWSGDAADADSGVAGFSTLWDSNPTTTPDNVIEHGWAAVSETSPALGIGTWYFHLSTCDEAGNCSQTLHLGPFYIETATTLGPGYYEETEPGLMFDASWLSLPHASHSAGAAMASTANAAELNVSFNGSAFTLYRLMSSTQGPMEVCIDALPCQLIPNYSATTRYQVPVGFHNLGGGPHTLVVRAATDQPVTLDAVQIHDLTPLAPGYYESDNAALSYSPGWQTSADAQSSGGSIEYTVSPNGVVQFAFNGNGLVLYRVTNKLRGAMEVCIDGDCKVISNYTLWVRRQQPVGFYGLTPGDHTVVIRSTSTAITDIDALEVLDLMSLSSGYYEETQAEFQYFGDWQTVFNGSASGGSLITSDEPVSHMTFMFSGNAFTLYRLTNSARGTMEVCIDDLPCELVSNYTPATRWQQPVSFFGLTTGDHLVVIRNSGGTIMDIDAVEVHNLPVLTNGYYEQDDPALVYVGGWSTVVNGSASGGSIAFNQDEQASLSFLFSGNAFTLYRLTNSARGAMEVCIDALPCQLVSNYSPAANWQTPVTFSGLADGIHLVEVRNTAATAMDIDAVEVVSLATLPAGSYEETEAALHYTGSWSVNNNAGHSGGSILYTSEPTANVMFQYTGTDLTLHRMMNSARSLIEVCVDAMPCVNVNNYSATTLRNQTVAITGIPSGTHVVIIRNASNAVMDIDALDFAP